MTTNECLQFIELRKRELDLARASVERPEDEATLKEWYSVAMQVDELCDRWDPEEQKVLIHLNRTLRLVYSSASGVEQLINRLTPRT